MIQASQAIQYIEQGLKQLISSQQIFGKLAHSQTSISLYLNTKSPRLLIRNFVCLFHS